MRFRIFQVDAFTDELFSGNPAAVVPLETWLPDATMLAIAGENNLAETAFFVPTPHDETDFKLRWFTPTTEVALCGHATLATAHVLKSHMAFRGSSVTFACQSGIIAVDFVADRYLLDFPAIPVEQTAESDSYARPLADALGAEPSDVLLPTRPVNAGKNLLAVFESESQIRALDPNLKAIKSIHEGCVCCTAPGDEVDFVSRFFAPGAGVDEDPVTGSTHAMLTPFWSVKLGRSTLSARQLSKRGGTLACEYRGQRVGIGGKGVTYLVGEIIV